jgi:glycosyltransferase involved in cell wall biosynthesis
MDWYPNRDAVNHFVSRILPDLLILVPSVKFLVAGRIPSDSFAGRFVDKANIEFTGFVSDMRSVLGNATVCVVPLRIGSGTRLKILEAAAMAKSIVSTHLGAEGLDFVNGKEIVLEDDPSRFAKAVALLLSSPRYRDALGYAARKRVEAEYSFVPLRKALRLALDTFKDQCDSERFAEERAKKAVF